MPPATQSSNTQRAQS